MRLIALAAVLMWADVVCPVHYNAPCYNTGQYRSINGRGFMVYKCSCGDSYLVPQ